MKPLNKAKNGEVGSGQASTAVTKLQSAIRTLRMSPQLLQGFKSRAINMDLKPLIPIAAVDTRWNSEFYQMSRALEYKMIHNLHATEVERPEHSVAKDQWKVISEIVGILEPLEKATKSSSAS
jgi:hypothetical protein